MATQNVDKEGSILWKNLYYMLAYSIEGLKYLEVGKVNFEEIESLQELMGRLLVKSIEALNVENMVREYNPVTVCTNHPSGRLEILKSYQTGCIGEGKLWCTRHKFDMNSEYNRIIKSAIKSVLSWNEFKQGTNYVISDTTRNELHRYLEYFMKIPDASEKEIDITGVRYKDAPINYRPALTLSVLILNNVVVSDLETRKDALTVNGKSVWRIFEAFVRNFLSREYNHAKVVKPSLGVESTIEGKVARWEHPDMVLIGDGRYLVLDTKWYTFSSKESNRTANKREVESYAEKFIGQNQIDDQKCRSGEITFNCCVLYARRKFDGANHLVGEKSNLRATNTFEMYLNMNQEFEDIKKELVSIVDGVLFYTRSKGSTI